MLAGEDGEASIFAAIDDGVANSGARRASPSHVFTPPPTAFRGRNRVIACGDGDEAQDTTFNIETFVAIARAARRSGSNSHANRAVP